MKKIYVLLLGIAFIGCSSDDEVSIALSEYEKILAYSTGDAEMALSAVGLDTIHSDLQHRFDVYKVIYNTYYGDRKVKASAVVAVPKTEEPVPILSFQHGTIVADRDAPSKKLLNQLPLFSIASTGYIVVIPDYIGFGNSNDIFHPYYIAEPMGMSVADAIIATKEMMSGIEGTFNGEVFLAGYSQGGYATMAAHKYLEENPRGDLKLIASAPAAGGYNINGMQEYFFGLETYEEPFYMAFVAMAYKEYYNRLEPMSTYFQEPYASRMEKLFNGEYSGSQINAQLTTAVADYVQPDMLENFESSETYRFMREKFQENSLIEWDPVAPVFMYHGTADVTVPYSNTTTSYELLVNEADDLERIKLFPIEGATHSTGALPYVKDVYFRFKRMK